MRRRNPLETIARARDEAMADRAKQACENDDRDYLFMGIEPDRLERARIYVAYREGPAPAESTEPVKRVCVCSKGHRRLCFFRLKECEAE